MVSSSTKRLWPIATVNFFYYTVLAGFLSFLAMFLIGRDFTAEMVGQTFAIFTISRVGFGLLWSYWADKYQAPLQFFQLAHVISVVCLIPLIWVSDHLLTMVLVIVSLTCYLSVISQVEVLTLKAANDQAKLYNRIRLFGSIGFIVAAVVIGFIIDWIGRDGILYFAIAMLLCILLSSMLLSVSGDDRSTSDDSSIDESFISRCLASGFVVFMAASILLQMSFAPYIGFFTQYLAQYHYSGAAIGAIFAFGTVAEIVLFIYAGSILAKFNIKTLFSFCLLITALRWWALTWAVESEVWLLLTQALHAFSYGLIHSVSIYFIRQHFSDKQQSRGQTMYLTVTYGIGGAIGAYIAGISWQSSPEYTLILASCCVLVAALLILLSPSRIFQFSSANKSV